jgi:mannosylglycerate hydrolase
MVTLVAHKNNIKKIFIVSHTHWDREWYQPFQEYRLRLLKTIDKLLNILQKDNEYKYFLLDGQVVPLEDYLELRPENREVLFEMIRNGRIGVGPWYNQPDEWLSYPESLVRNLLMGKKICEKLNLPILKVGYTPDTFGHTAQLPQILNGFDIDSFLFMRGLGDEGEDLGVEFLWSAPDGSKVIAIHLLTSYSNGVFLGSLAGHPHIFYGDIYPKTVKIWKSGIVEEVAHFGIYEKEPEVAGSMARNQIEWLLEQMAAKIRSAALLVLNGADHAPPQESLTMIIKELRKLFEDREIIHGNLEDYLAEVRRINYMLPIYKGELRAARYEWLVPNTISTRIPQIKYPSYVSQTIVPYYVEPLATISWLLGGQYPHEVLDLIWKLVLQNLAHDSICGCGVDQVHSDVNTRFRYAIEISKNLLYENLDFLARNVNTSKLGEAEHYLVVFNPLSWKVSSLVELHSELPLGRYIIVDDEGKEFPATLDATYIKYTFMKKNMIKLLFIAKDLPPLGWRTYKLKCLRSDFVEPIIQHSNVIENEFFKVWAEPSNGGSLKIMDKLTGRTFERFGELFDEGDAGDEYTFCPPAEQKIYTSKLVPAEVHVRRTATYSCLEVKFVMNVPKCLETGRRSEELVELPVQEEVYLYPGIPRIDVNLLIENKALNHRLRVVFPTNLKITHSTADSHYYVVRRPVTPPLAREWKESPPVDHPMIYWVDVSDGSYGIMIATRGTPEYKLEPDGTLYLTLLRSVGALLENDLSTRPGAVNLRVQTPDAQCIGAFNFQYSIIPHKGDWKIAYKEALIFAIPPLAIYTDKHDGVLPPTSGLISLEPDNIIVTAVKKAEKDDAIIIRFYNASEEKIDSNLKLDTLKDFVSEVWLAKLSEEIVEQIKFDSNLVKISVGPWKIVTLKFRKKISP